MKFIKHDGGRSESKRPKQTNGCTVIALATVCKIPYDISYDILWKDGRISGCGYHLPTWCGGAFRMVNGYKFRHTIFNKSKMNAFNFIQNNPKGTFIVKIYKHVFAIIDGVVYDHTEPDGDEVIIEWVEVTKVKRNEKTTYPYKDELKKLKVHAKEKKKNKKPRKRTDFELFLYAGDDNEFGDCEFEDVTSKIKAKKRMKELILIEPRRSIELRKWKESQIVEDDILFYCGHDQKWLTE